MAVVIGSNISSLEAQRNLSDASASLAKSYERLSSGLRINDASDDAAGLAIASQLNSKARVFTQAIRNVNDGVSAASIAEGALTALKDISERQLELATEAANGTYSSTQRQALNTEANALVNEYNRIVGSTTFNGMNLFDPNLGSVLIQAGDSSSDQLQLGLSNQLERPVGDGTFTADSTLSGGSVDRYQFSVADFNGDGNLDLVVGKNVFLGNGNGTFQAAKSYSPSATFDSITEGDFNGDGKLDLLTLTTGGSGVRLGNGDGTFQSMKTVSNAGISVAVGDVNGDGKLDLVTTQGGGRGSTVLLGNGDGTFRAPVTLITGINIAEVAVGDFNGDGKLDIVSADATSGKATVFIGNGDGTFQAARTLTAGGTPASVSVGDFNGDGKLDLVTANYYGQATVFIGNGDGTFQAAITLADALGPSSVSVGDFNGDGRLDLAFANYLGQTAIFLGNGDGTFVGNGSGTFQTPLTAGLNTLGFVAVGDFNGDGRSDLAVDEYSSYEDEAQILISNGGYTSTSPYLNINTQSGALAALNTVNANLSRIESQLGSIGATTARFQTALGNLQTESENFEAASSRITDVDVASESSNLTREQILQQAAASVLAQANQQPEIALKLLSM